MKRFILSIVAVLSLTAYSYAQTNLNDLSDKELTLKVYTYTSGNMSSSVESIGEALALVNEMLCKQSDELDIVQLDELKNEYLQTQFLGDLAELCGVDKGLTRQEKITLIQMFENPKVSESLKKMNSVDMDDPTSEVEKAIDAVMKKGKMPKLKVSAEYAEKYNELYELLKMDDLMVSLFTALGLDEDNPTLKNLLKAFPIIYANASFDLGLGLEDIDICLPVLKSAEYQKMLELTYDAVSNPETLAMGVITKYAEFLEAKGIE